MPEVNFQSVLTEHQKQNRNVNTSTGTKTKNGGIDFKNDTVLLAAKADFESAQVSESNKATRQEKAAMESAHIGQSYISLFGQYQEQLSVYNAARATADQYSTQNADLVAKLAAQTEVVTALEGEKAESDTKIAGYEATIATLTLEKETKVAAHDAKLSNLNGQKTDCQGSISSLGSQISSLQSNISSLRGSITAETSDEEKASINSRISSMQSQISSLQSQKAAKEAELARIEQEISAEEAAKQNTITTYNGRIDAEKAKLAAERANNERIQGELAEATYIQNCLKVEQANMEKLWKDASVFATSIKTILADTETKLAEIAEKEEKADEKTAEADAEYEKAKDNTDKKENIYKETEESTKAKYEKEEKRSFMA